MVKNNSYLKAIPVLAAFFVMGFCDIVGISSDYMQKSFNWSPTMTGFVPFNGIYLVSIFRDSCW